MSEPKQDFPIAFAEQKEYPTNTEMYVEWLDNSTEFPILSSSSGTQDIHLDGDHWELLKRKEFTEEEDSHTLVPLEEDWLTAEKNLLYSEVMEKNATELQPKQYTVKSIWIENKHKEEEEENSDDYEDIDDDLGSELIDVKKSQSRRANKLSRLRRLHDLKVVDNYVGDIYKIATTKGVMKPPASEADRIISTWGGQGRSDKQNALIKCSKYTHNMNRYTFKHLAFSKRHSKGSNENSEFSVLSKISVKL